MISPGQRWVIRTSCHSFIAEIIEIEDDKFGIGKVVQILNITSTCMLNVAIGKRVTVAATNNDWELLLGQDAP